jgi:hypothetical protein
LSPFFIGVALEELVAIICYNFFHLDNKRNALEVLTAYSARVNSCAMKICIIRCKYVEDSIGSTWAFDAPAQNFVSGITAPLRGLIL